MNHDDHKPDLQPLIEPGLEARVVAWVAGEASAFEVAELERLSGEKPELAIFKRRIAAVHGLVAEAVRPDKEPLRLSTERRAKLLQAISAGDNKSAPGSKKILVPSFEATKKAHRKDRQWLLALAACLTLGLFTILSFPGFRRCYGMNAKQSSMADESGKREEATMQVSLPPASPTMEDERRAKADPRQRNQSANEPNKKRESDQRNKFNGPSRTYGKLKFSPSLFAASPATVRAIGESSLAARDATNQNLVGEMGAFRNGSNGKGATGGSSKNSVNAPVSSNEEKVVLSPFEVTASKNIGYASYASTDTSSGSRFPTELKDGASTLSVVTKQFLSDVGASNQEQLLRSAQSTRAHGVVEHASVAQPEMSFSYNPRTNLASGAVQPDSDQFRQKLSETDTSIRAAYESTTTAMGPGSPVAQKTAVTGDKEIQKQDAGDDRPLVPPPVKPLPIPAPVEVNAAREPVSTFSLHVSDVSFRLAEAALANNEAMDRERIRPEEFYNAFSYGDPTPAPAEKISCRIEQAAHPFLQQRNLVRISLKVAASGRDATQPLHLTVLLDTSGSMEREDRAAIVHRAMESLISLLGPNDRVTLIGFARQPSLLAESLPGDQSSQILDVITRTPAEGGTNLEEALKLGGELAHRQFDSAAQNRIVLLTDGAANLGDADPVSLAASIEKLRQEGIAFDACGVGLEGLDDAMLENLTRKGDGRYYVLNSPEAADAGFAHQLAGAFRPAAENVKLQVRFNPARVGNYRLIGFEQHRLREEDFRNDSVDAAELAAEEAAVAVYQVEALPQGEGELGEVHVRFRDAASGNMVERSWTLNYEPNSPSFDRATPTMQLAGTAALLAEKLRGGQNGDAVKLDELAPVVNKLRTHYANEARVQELATMFEQARRLTGE